jgi:succinyldiaminopimelate transaminase
LRQNSNSPSYPVTTGDIELRTAIIRYCKDVLGASGEFDVLPTIGSKEIVALLPFLLQVKKLLIPEIAYPTYRVGGILASAEVIEVGIDAQLWPKDGVNLAWINSPSNPTGRVQDEFEMRAALNWSRTSGAVLASDECYFSFPDSKKGVSILSLTQGDNRGILAVHSLSKRSNLAGYRGSFIAGDPKLIGQLLEVRKHIGMMVPLPIQKATAIALSDEVHVTEQAQRYRARRKSLRTAIEALGFKVEHSDAGLYLWCTRLESDWDTVSWFADKGILVTPGSFYGDQGAKHVRIALTASDEKITEAANRLAN